MHMFGRKFSHSGKTTNHRSRELDIRKISFSGCSLSSGSSFSSTLSGSTIRVPCTTRAACGPSDLGPPLRLSERRLLDVEQRQCYVDSNFFDEDYTLLGGTRQLHHHSRTLADMELPPHVSPSDHSVCEISSTSSRIGLEKCPSLLHSRWSTSTVQSDYEPEDLFSSTVDTLDDGHNGKYYDSDISRPRSKYERNHFTAAVTRRSRLASLDDVGWKRRGIVFRDSVVPKLHPSNDEALR